MSYKAKMHPKVSQAEMSIFQALSLAGLTSGMVTQKPIILKSTVPDFCWLSKRKIVYLDGNPVHSSDKQQEHDNSIDELLKEKGWDVLRIPYEPPLTEKRLEQILETIKHFLNFEEET